jgi:CheY-like chemotaxis protein
MLPVSLSVGYDPELLGLRSLLLREGTPLQVFEASDFASALQMIRSKQRLDLILLCHTVPDHEQWTIVQVARNQFGPIPVLSIFAGLCPNESPGITVRNDSQQLLDAVGQALLKKQSAAPAQGRGNAQGR